MRLKPFAVSFAREPVLIVMLLVTSGSVWAFCEMADEVMEGSSHEIDQRIVVSLRNPEDYSDPIGPKWFEEFMRDMTALGGVGMVTLVSVTALSFLWILGNRAQAILLVIAILGAMILSFSMKALFDRPRPDLVPHESYVYTHSFPSGHSMQAAAVYLTLGVVLAQLIAVRSLKIFLIVLALAVTVVVGVSRVYLGVHWPTDVLAGWTAGAAWACGCWLVAQSLRLRTKTVSLKPQHILVRQKGASTEQSQ